MLGTNCEETQTFLQLPETLAQLRIRLMDIGLSFINQLLLEGQSLRGLESWNLGGAPPSPVVSCLCTTLPRSHGLQDGSSLCLEGGPQQSLSISPGIKMSSYEVLPATVDRKTLLQSEFSNQRPTWGRRGGRTPRCLDFLPHLHSGLQDRSCSISWSLTSD